MNTVIEEFWQAYLYSSNGQLSGLAITLWLLSISLAIGFVLSLFMAIGRNSARPYIAKPIWLFTYVFRGTPLYVQILFIYTGMYSLELVKQTPH